MVYLWQAVDAEGESSTSWSNPSATSTPRWNWCASFWRSMPSPRRAWWLTTCGHTPQRPAISASSACVSAAGGGTIGL